MFKEIHPRMRPGIWPHEALVHWVERPENKAWDRGASIGYREVTLPSPRKVQVWLCSSITELWV